MDRRITTEILESCPEVEGEVAEDVEFQVPHIKRRLLGDFGRSSMLDAPLSEHMKVYLRIRPFTENELEKNESQGCLDVESDYVVNTVAPKDSHYYKKAARGQGKTYTTNKYTFSNIFKEDTTQKDFFNSTLLDLVKDFIDGQNCLVFSYGVTSSGKTYTIQGEPKDAGLLPRALDVLFNSISGRQYSGVNLKPELFMGVTRLTEEQELYEKKMKERVMKMSCEEDMDVMSLLGDDASDVSMATNTTTSSDASISSITRDFKDSDFLDAVNDRVREETKVSVEEQGQIKYSVWVSFAEIYNEQIYDLLESIPKKKNVRRPCLKLSDDQNGSPYIKGLKFIHVTSADEAYKLLTIGQRNLKTASTKLNQNSSRRLKASAEEIEIVRANISRIMESHCIFSIKVLRVIDKDSPHVARVSILSLCDLAGSERYTKTKGTGERLKEAGNINTSLMTLGRCIETLRFNQSHKDHQRIIPFRDSKLTRLFQNFFVGRGKAVMIVNVNQCASMFDETQHVFKFSAIASQVIVKQNPVFLKPRLPVVVPSPKLIPRSSIMWATTPAKEKVDALPEASNVPLPEESDDDLNESGDAEIYTQENIDELLGIIAKLETDLNEEVKSKAKLEARVRKEVCSEMMRQFTEIEEQCSEQIRIREQLAEEMAEKRIQILINAERAKRKKEETCSDTEDEWVSSILLHQEKVKVEERNATIKELKEAMDLLKRDAEQHKTREENWDKEKKDLENQIKVLRNSLEKTETDLNKEEDHSDANLIENLTHQLQQSRERLQEQDKEVLELNDMLTEAGETFVQKEKEIEKLKELNTEYEKRLEQMSNDLKQLERVAEDSKVAMETADQSLSKREECVSTLQAEIRSLEGEVNKYKNKAHFFEEQIVGKEKEVNELRIKYEQGQAEYTKSEEALIHGFTAEIANLKSQIFNFKTQLYGIKSPLKSPGGSLRSPDPARMRLFSMSPRKTPGKEVQGSHEHYPENTNEENKPRKLKGIEEDEKEMDKSGDVKSEVESDKSNLETVLIEKTKELENAHRKIKELEPLMKDYFSKSKLLTEADIQLEKLNDAAEYKNKAIIDCENRVQELETELKHLKAQFEEKKEIIRKLEKKEKEMESVICELKEKGNECRETRKEDNETQTVSAGIEIVEEDTGHAGNNQGQLQLQITEKNKEIQELNDKLYKLKTGYKAKDLYFNEASEKCVELEFRINEKEIENEEFISQLDEAKSQMKMLQEALNKKVEELARTGEELAVTSLESEKSKRMVIEHRANCESLMNEIKSLQEKMQSAASDMLEVSSTWGENNGSNMSILKNELLETETKVQELQDKIKDLENTNKSLDENLTAKADALKVAESEIEKLKGTVEEKDSHLSLIHKEQNTSREDKDTQSDICLRTSDEIQTLKAKVQQNESEKADLEEQLKDITEKHSSLLENTKNLEGTKEEVLKLESLLNDKEQMLTDLRGKVLDMENTQSSLQKELKLEKDKIYSLEKLQVQLKEKDEEIEMFKENLEAALSELESKEKEQVEIEELRKTIEESTEKLTVKEQELGKLGELNCELQERLAVMDGSKSRKEVLEESMHDLESAVVDKEMELCEKDKLINEQKTVINNLKEEIEKLQGEKTNLNERISQVENDKQEELLKHEKNVMENGDKFKKTELELKVSAEKRDALEKALKEAEEKFMKTESDLKESINTRVALERTMKESEERLLTKDSELEETVKQKEALDEKVEDLQKKLNRLEEEMEEMSMKNDSFEIERSRLQGKLDEAWEKIYKLEDDVEEKSLQLNDFKTRQEELKQALEEGDQNKHADLLVKQSELSSDVIRYKDLHEKVEAELKGAKNELEKVREQMKYLEDQTKSFNEVIQRLTEEISEKEKAMSNQKIHYETCLNDKKDSSELEEIKKSYDRVNVEKMECLNEIEKQRLELVCVKENCDKELKAMRLELEKITAEKDVLKNEVSDTKLLKERENEHQSELSLKNVEIETLKLEVKIVNEELSSLKVRNEVVKESQEIQQSVVDKLEKVESDCDTSDVIKLQELQRLYDAEKKKNEEYQKLLTESSEASCLSPQNGVRKLRKAKIDADNALIEAQYTITSLEKKVHDLEEKLGQKESRVNMITSPCARDSQPQRKLNFVSTKLQETEAKNVSMIKEINELQATVERLEKELTQARENRTINKDRVADRRSRLSALQNDPRQSISSPTTKIELSKVQEREHNLREQLKESNEKMTEWLNKFVETETQLKQKKQELNHAQEMIKELKMEGERSIKNEIKQYMELTNELKQQIIIKEEEIDRKSHAIENIRHQINTASKDLREKEELIAIFKETMQEQETMLEQQEELINEKESKIEANQAEYSETLEKYKHLLESKDFTSKEHNRDEKKMVKVQADLDSNLEKVQKLEDDSKQLREKLTALEREKADVDKKLKKTEEEKTRLKSALNENNVEMKELEKSLTDARKEIEALRSHGADKNAEMHLEEAKRDMEKTVHELNAKIRNLQCQNKEVTFKLSSAEEKLKTMAEDGRSKHNSDKELEKFREERDKLVSALEACLKKKDTEIKQLKDVIKQLKDKEIQITQSWHEEREKIATGLMGLQNGPISIKKEVDILEDSVPSTVKSPSSRELSTFKSPVQTKDHSTEEDHFTKPLSSQSATRSSSKSRPPRPAPPKSMESDTSAMIEMLNESPGSARKGSARRGRKRPSPSGPDDLPPRPKRRSHEPLAETSIISESSEDYSTHLQVDATPKAAAKSLKRMRKKTGSTLNIEEVQAEESANEGQRRGSKRNAKNRLLQSFRESPIGKTSKKLLENIAEKFSPTKSPSKSVSPPNEEEETKRGRKRNRGTKENIPVESLDVPEKKSSRGKGRHKLYKEDTYISEPFDSTGDFIQSPENVHRAVTRSLRSRKH